ncbi:F0F1 ATP synthase subunit epsilon [Cupriavidus sp. USMAA2-4]|uniref:ATP synthase epsilon chain n=1 Tax=Cupriavidus malaysiensis TaxID=367825 RepID=A0ABM6FGG8_9BURK|nr:MULTISPECIES: F0F1 ATP synthase subunit epsilon [Cupriavidus]AOY95013.1 F0F1 ATP synthase subunit epsilon [Cupriavidus sp. USMAA2-4]AOZ03879.1 F0F1 ATP synthase subunit epsilon [Cupriavidus sp. USMAHM13]AOZ11046.1 F0F1 ATP synthase subunit epsilon [Cupriavidus malaysiensis]
MTPASAAPRALHLRIATPDGLAVDEAGVRALRAEDDSGAFGVLPEHADFLTVLVPCVVRWHGADGTHRFCMVEGGMLRVDGGAEVAIATAAAVLGDSLEAVAARVREARERRLEAARNARVEQTRLHARAVREIVRCLRPDLHVDGIGRLEP